MKVAGRMARTTSDASGVYAGIAARHLRAPDVTEGRMFGATALKVSGKVFAMLLKGALVVKLPQARAEALSAAKTAQPFDPGHGRIMKEWVGVPVANARSWPGLVDEAKAFVDGQGGAVRARTSMGRGRLK